MVQASFEILSFFFFGCVSKTKKRQSFHNCPAIDMCHTSLETHLYNSKMLHRRRNSCPAAGRFRGRFSKTFRYRDGGGPRDLRAASQRHGLT